MKVSIFVPVYNAQENFKLGLLENLQSLGTDSNYEVLFVDSSSQDLTVELIRERKFKVTTITTAKFDHGGTRAMAKELCNGDVIVFLTQDALPLSENAISELVSVFEDESIGAAYGRQIPYKDTNLFGKHLRGFNYTDKSYVRSLEDKKQFGIKTGFLSNSFSAYRRTAMDDIGWFKDGLILGEDTYAGAKLLLAGYKLAYVSEAQVYHSHGYTVWQEFQRYFDIGVFHQMEGWILKAFGKPEGEGMRYIKSEFKYLISHKAYHLIPQFFIRNGMKFLGYKMGKHYSVLPHKLIKKFSMHHRWWGKYWMKEAKND